MAESTVSIGVPTYRRPELLRRALECIANQTYHDIEVFVSDNATPGSQVEAVIDEYRSRIPNLKFVRQAVNIGAVPNFMYLLQQVSAPYFMWLADDDEISPNYVEQLLAMLEANPAAVTVMGHWIRMEDEQQSFVMPTSSFPQRSAFERCMQFIWRTDDAFIYGLHRTAALRSATYTRYWPPNQAVLVNFAYPYLLDMVLAGCILLTDDETVRWISHSYSEKRYELAPNRFDVVMANVVRRVNVHWLYWTKIVRALGLLALLPAFAVSCTAMLRDLCVWLFARRKVRRLLARLR